MKERRQIITLGLLLPILSLTSCSTETKLVKPDVSKIDKDNIAFVDTDIIQDSFGGLGVEWGAYEDTDKIIEGGWDKIIDHMDHLGAARVRVMVSYDWFCQNFDDKDNDDKNDDTWTYNFTNKYAKNLFEILEYCETHHIDVAFGAWNVIGNLSGVDVWDMMEEVTSDIRWAKMSADIVDFLVHQKGFTCIKWFVSSNEPNWLGAEGASKNFKNTYAKWEQGVKNVRAAFDKVGLEQVGIVGGDTTGYEGTEEYFTNIAKNIPDKVGDYGCHLYLSNIAVDRGELYDQAVALSEEVKKIDKGFGTERKVDVWEAGLRDGKTVLDCQSLINTSSYAVRMVDYTIQCLAAGVNGIVYWDFDDAMHFMYTNNTMTPKEWGMFSSLAEASSAMQELRPWYHTSSLLCHLFQKGNKVYSPLQNNNELDNSFRSLATVNDDGTKGGFIAVNTGLRTVKKTFYLDDKVEGDKLYIYIFNENSYRLDEDGYIKPNYVIDGSLNKKLSLDVEKGTAIFVSNERL